MSSSDRVITAQISGDSIFETSYYTQPKKVGIRIEVYEELHAEYMKLVPLFTDYQEKLIELGILPPPPKSLEEIVKEQAEELRESREILKRLSQQLDLLTEVRDGTIRSGSQGGSGTAEVEGGSMGSVQSSNRDAERPAGSPAVPKR